MEPFFDDPCDILRADDGPTIRAMEAAHRWRDERDGRDPDEEVEEPLLKAAEILEALES